MKNFFRSLFDDNNTINEKSVVGFIAFFLLCIAFGVDIVTGWLGREFVVNELVFNGFMVLVLGSFGIASIDKWINKKHSNTNDDSDNTAE
jgi:ABC-type uncharacterized transport system permease subunit